MCFTVFNDRCEKRSDQAEKGGGQTSKCVFVQLTGKKERLKKTYKAFVSGFCFEGFVLDWFFFVIEVCYEMMYSYNEKTVDLNREKNRKNHRFSKILSRQVGSWCWACWVLMGR